MIEAVIFDMDGVIIDSEPMHREVENDIFKSLGISMAINEHDSFCGKTMKSMWSILKDKYKLSNSVDELVNTKRENFFKYLKLQKELKPIEGIPELIDSLYKNKYKLAVASSSPMEIIDFIIKSYGLDKYFNVIITGESIAKSKPEPDIFLHAAEKLKVEPHKCIVIEDSHNGATAAKRAGMKCIGFKNPNSGNQDLSIADKIIISYKEIKVEQLNEI